MGYGLVHACLVRRVRGVQSCRLFLFCLSTLSPTAQDSHSPIVHSSASRFPILPVLALLTLDHSLPAERSGQADFNLSQQIYDLYDALHKTGVVHRDVEGRHVCRVGGVDVDEDKGKAGMRMRMRLIDFEGAEEVGVGSDECREEGLMVRRLVAGE